MNVTTAVEINPLKEIVPSIREVAGNQAQQSDNWGNAAEVCMWFLKNHRQNINCLDFLQVSNGGKEILHFNKDDIRVGEFKVDDVQRLNDFEIRKVLAV